ncbi:DctP family TRAP transporter solute-binding subunit [Roseospira marina]|uniref:DctP family TRAP transporter solute-binding subunit n=1 Tax=Roseospira marina TaxID=140057 RepID=A0A5M6IC32_9PROT|nr:DctP family TRAP transporter solute-binding subunit [Roseospira marina]KAA5605309.1 DctP family TRAP transporter solute-binding subunit [Roseospira marina]MBB4314777.1 tripartite ATP-independent transporter DctP family solute receptor [Roseospira marina]MBB5087766.1 tripartite ATP-independent transporter DctP family solute receptor [Roseospira marina]
MRFPFAPLAAPLAAPLVAAVLLASASVSLAATELKFAHAAPDTDLQQALAEHFADEVAKRTDGEVTVKIFPHGQLGNDQQMISGTRSGIVDIVMSGLNNVDGLMPQVGGLLLPYIFTSREHAYKVLDGEVGQSLLADFEDFGMKGLGFPENGYRNITNSRGPIREPEDVRGLNIRTNNSAALNEMFALLGANPQPLPVSELYTALETGVVDAQEHPIPITHSFHYDEVQDYLSMTEHSYSMLFIAMNLKKFNALTPEQQQVIVDVAQEATAYQRQMSIDKEASILADLKERGMEINTDVDKAAFQAAVASTWDSYKAKFGDDMITKILAAQ